ncbi:TRAP transporter large permease [Profundibacter sp.]
MTDLSIGGMSILVAFFMILIRVPVGAALGVSAFGGIYFVMGWRPAWGVLASVPFDFASHWTLSSIPMFLLMGYIAYYTKLSDGLFKAASAWLRWMPGGLAAASVGASAGFSAVTGSSLACSAAMGRIVVPQMLEKGYDKGLATGVVAASGTIGSMIPPSIILLIFGIFAEVPINQLFVAGVAPGILTALMFIAMIVIRVSLKPSLAPKEDIKESWGDRFATLIDTWPTLVLILGVFGGLFGGFFSPTEAGAVGAALAMILATVQRTLTWETFRLALKETVQTTASVFIVAIGAALLTRLMALTGVAEFLSTFAAAADVGPLMLIFGLSIVYLLLGMFLDPIGIMLLTLPIFLPIAEDLGINLIWFGIIITKLLEMGLITPPVGLNVYVIKGIVGNAVSLERIFKGVGWFLIADVFTLALLIAFPFITLYLPGLMD